MEETLLDAIKALDRAADDTGYSRYAKAADALRDLLGRVEAASEMKPLYGEIVGGAFQVSGGGTYRVWFERVE